MTHFCALKEFLSVFNFRKKKKKKTKLLRIENYFDCAKNFRTIDIKIFNFFETFETVMITGIFEIFEIVTISPIFFADRINDRIKSVITSYKIIRSI